MRRRLLGIGLLGFGEQFGVLLARQKHPLDIAFEQHVQVVERDEDLADDFGRLGRRTFWWLRVGRGSEQDEQRERQ